MIEERQNRILSFLECIEKFFQPLLCSYLLRLLHRPARFISLLSLSRFDEVLFKSGASAVSLSISTAVFTLIYPVESINITAAFASVQE